MRLRTDVFKERYTSAIAFAFIIFLIFATVMMIRATEVRVDNGMIDERIAGYFTEMNRKDFVALEKHLSSSTPNSNHINKIKEKAGRIGFEGIQLKKIYPALISNKLAIVGFETEMTVKLRETEAAFHETNVFFLRKEHGEWKIAKPEDLADIEESRVSEMIDGYRLIIKENIKENLWQGMGQNMKSFDRVRRGSKE